MSVRAKTRGEGRDRQLDCPRSTVRHGTEIPADLGEADRLVRIGAHIDIIVAWARRLGGAVRARVDRCPSAACTRLGYCRGACACHRGPLAKLSSSHHVVIGCSRTEMTRNRRAGRISGGASPGSGPVQRVCWRLPLSALRDGRRRSLGACRKHRIPIAYRTGMAKRRAGKLERVCVWL